MARLRTHLAGLAFGMSLALSGEPPSQVAADQQYPRLGGAFGSGSDRSDA